MGSLLAAVARRCAFVDPGSLVRVARVRLARRALQQQDRLAEGRIVCSMKHFIGWRAPNGSKGPFTEPIPPALQEQGHWRCQVCGGTMYCRAKWIMTEEGRTCQTCCTFGPTIREWKPWPGPPPTASPSADATTPQASSAPSPSIASAPCSSTTADKPTATGELFHLMNERQIEYLQETLTVKQWEQFQALG